MDEKKGSINKDRAERFVAFPVEIPTGSKEADILNSFHAGKIDRAEFDRQMNALRDKN